MYEVCNVSALLQINLWLYIAQSGERSSKGGGDGGY